MSQTKKTIANDPQWVSEQTDNTRKAVLLFAKIAIAIFILFWGMDLLIYPELATRFLLLRIVCALGYVPLLFIVPRVQGRRALTSVGIAEIWWVSAIICLMLTATGYERSLYYAGLVVTLLAMGVVFPWTWRTTLVAGLGVAAMFGIVALTNPGMDVRSAINNLGFILGAIGISIAADVRDTRAMESAFATRADLAEANGRLREIDKVKTEFFGNISHELRTPLTLILSPLESLLQDSDQLTERTKSYLLSMHRNGGRLLRLVNNLLDFAKLDAGKVFLKYEAMRLDQLIENMFPSFEALGGSKGVALRFNSSNVGPVHVDYEMMEVVFQNLLANAIKFTPREGSVTVSVSETESDVIVTISDTGVGIASKDLNRIFDRFGQADSSATRRFGGTGIGLALVKEYVDLHGGSVTVESQLGSGSTFVVRLPKGLGHIREELRDRRAINLPVARERREGNNPPRNVAVDVGDLPAAPGEVGSITEGPRILIVEDNPDLRAFLSDVLGKVYRVQVASDGEEGIRRARTEQPDLIVSDVMMPKVSGYELVRTVKTDVKTAAIPVILLTAKKGAESTVEGFQHGADDYLGKPFSVRELFARIAVQLKLRELSRQLVQAQKTALLNTLAAGLAHEIKNPINAIANGLPVLQTSFAQSSNKESARLVPLMEVMLDSSQRIVRIIDDLLNISAVNQSALKAWYPSKSVESTLRLLNLGGASTQVSCSFLFDGVVLGNPGQLNQVVLNVIDNAMKSTRERGSVHVETRPVPGGVAIVVRDTGPGIKSDVLPRIFDPFFTTREVGQGTGLGLHVSKEIVEQHGGSISVDTQEGMGATFTIRLPSRCEEASPPPSPLTPTRNSGP